MLWFVSLLWAAETRLSKESVAVGGTLHYTVWEPENYDARKRYPLLVMLHGLGDSDSNWTRGRVLRLYRAAVADGLLPEQIVLVPDGKRGYWSDQLQTLCICARITSGNNLKRSWLPCQSPLI